MKRLPETPSQIVSRLLSNRRCRPEVGEFAAPIGATEEAIAEIWSEVLRIDRIGRNDVFLDFGGDSVHMFRIAARIWSQFEVKIPMDMFFDNPTVGRFAEVVTKSIKREDG
jgi:acyl carrier protein